ncbi:mitochondrial GTPase 1 [Hetaerina americana]|uniref:mitochondrial GTPase 1 n=1 Tax=Hetaerina americana TaxID=62018 RepID=UPI003A7F4142
MATTAANVSQKFRKSFKIVSKDILRWFPGHMGRGLRKMQQILKTVDCVIEVHDARVPITGRNPDFQHKICGLRPHVLVLNKKDLIEAKHEEAIRNYLKNTGISSVFFGNCKDQKSRELDKVIPVVSDLICSSNRYNRSEEKDYSVMVIGVPNVGKSSLINWLRNKHLNKGNAAQVGAVAGITRRVQNRIKVSEEPKVYLLDTPGILQPSVKDVEAGLKLALCACLQDHLVGEIVIADYLLYTLNKMQNFKYVELMGLEDPSDEIGMVLVKGAIKLDKFQKVKHYDGSLVKRPNIAAAAIYLIREFREGRLGKIVLDSVDSCDSTG